ncbi:MAG TPA: hypothetical protein ENK57_01575 [Polyangiaceae bacterium]|nr:hypothetical protein [Polyangiaceae bacterium]
MSNRLRALTGKASAALFLTLTCSLGCGCLAAEDVDGGDAVMVADSAIPVDVADPIASEAIDLGREIAILEAAYQQQVIEQQNALSGTDAEGDGDGDGRSSNPDPTPWQDGDEDNPDPTPWHGNNSVNPDPTPWLDGDDDEDDELGTESAYAADTSGGSGWSHRID